ncbi:hypothetical protein PG996_011759 [Apiospora saccharicola]|uniref:Zn(2)-C6 fungal-type domain-containing protein n=1 Tax=Apiospora saccharicola TaxID=335842 RepID=A0ABR1UFZ2_9PEZI
MDHTGNSDTSSADPQGEEIVMSGQDDLLDVLGDTIDPVDEPLPNWDPFQPVPEFHVNPDDSFSFFLNDAAIHNATTELTSPEEHTASQNFDATGSSIDPADMMLDVDPALTSMITESVDDNAIEAVLVWSSLRRSPSNPTSLTEFNRRGNESVVGPISGMSLPGLQLNLDHISTHRRSLITPSHSQHKTPWPYDSETSAPRMKPLLPKQPTSAPTEVPVIADRPQSSLAETSGLIWPSIHQHTRKRRAEDPLESIRWKKVITLDTYSHVPVTTKDQIIPDTSRKTELGGNSQRRPRVCLWCRTNQKGCKGEMPCANCLKRLQDRAENETIGNFKCVSSDFGEHIHRKRLPF